MNNVSDTEKSKQSGKKDNVGKIYVKQPHKILKDCSLKSTNDDVQRAIEGLKEIPDEELQEFLDDEDFMEGLDVVDAWERDEDKNREVERKMDSTEKREKRSSREHHRQRQRKGSCSREKPKKEDKKREETLRRDPAKSTKDIERDKIRTKRDTENKLLAEKEKAIKHLLDSGNVVPPGTESEAIQSITEKQNMERAQQRERRSRERRRSVDRFVKLSPSRRRTPDKLRSSPHRRKSPFVMSPERRRSPFNRASTERHRSPKYSPGKRRYSPRYIFDRQSPSASSSDRRRSPRPSWDRRPSADRRWSAERHRKRGDLHERRRSRSRDRRSRSLEHSRRKSSRSPTNRRYSPRRRSRSPEQKRTRKRSPFINELARQLRDEAMKPANANSGYVRPTTSSLMERLTPLLNAPPVYQQETNITAPLVTSATYLLQPGPSGPSPSVLPMPPTFMNFDISAGPSMAFESPVPLHPLPADYSADPVIYNQPNTTPIQAPPPPVIRPPLLSTPVPPPQPVPAPMMDHNQMPYNPSHVLTVIQPSSIHQFESTNKSPTALSSASQSYKERKSTTPYNIFQERLKTPEPPVISKPKQFEKTSLSSLLEASVSAKDSLNIPVLYPGFKPEIMRHCEQALCQLPLEDPRLKMKGRFFYVREEEDAKNESEDHTSNSILLQRGKTKICWDENTEELVPIAKPTTQMHQKICQTDKLETETKGVQTNIETATRDCQTQFDSNDLEENIEEKQPIANRLDWNINETYEYEPKYRNVEDLRWSLNNSSQRRFWNRQTSPSRKSDEHKQEHEHHANSVDHMSRNVRLDSTFNSRNDYTSQQAREYHDHDRYSSNYRRLVEQDDYHDRRSDHSRGESPMELEDSDDELETDNTFQKESNWYKRGKALRGKTHIYRGKHTEARPYQSRAGFRGKF